MARHPTRNPRLQDRDFDILQHVLRYRLTTPEILHRLFFGDSERNAVTKVTSKLCEFEFLQSHRLYSSFTYFTLGRRGAKVVGISSNKLGPLGSQTLYREFGTLIFCCGGGVQRERLRTVEIVQKFPGFIFGKIDASHYYVDEHDGVRRVGYIWVDGGGDVDHIVRTVDKDIVEKRRAVPALRELIEKGRFTVAVVTLNPDKQQVIAGALPRIAAPIFFRVEVAPDLTHLLPGVRHV